MCAFDKRLSSIRTLENELKLRDEGDPITKYNSLLHILKDQEEFTLNADGIIISSNLEAVNVTGYEEPEVLGEHIRLFYCDEDKRKADFDLEKAARLNYTFVTGIRRKKKGGVFWAKMKFTALKDSNDRVRGYKVLLQDTTHHALSNVRVQTLKEEYLAIFNNPFVGSFKFRASDFKVMMINPKSLEMAGRENSHNLYFNSFFYSRAQLDEFMSLLIKDKRVDGFKFLMNDGKRGDNWVVASARYFESKGFVEGVLVDISEQQTQFIELQRLNSQLDNFTYHASHDLRAPLTTIMGLINLAKIEPNETQRYLHMVEERVIHLDTLLKDLISVTYNNKTGLECSAFNFKDEIERIVSTTNNASHPSIVSLEIEQSHPYFTDPLRLRTVLRNLISNAFKFRRSEAAEHYIDLKVKVEPSHAAVQLKDNGIGIEWSMKDRVWEMFFRATEKATGTGLGLYIVRSMVEKLNGNISFESTVNEGTTFLLAIPNCMQKESVQLQRR